MLGQCGKGLKNNTIKTDEMKWKESSLFLCEKIQLKWSMYAKITIPPTGRRHK